jgi:hypothetical protein
VVSWDVRPDDKRKFTLAGVPGRGPIAIKDRGSVEIRDASVKALTLRVEFLEPIPADFALRQSYPNPFNPRTTIGFDLPVRSSVTVMVYDMLGREVGAVVRDRAYEAGVQKEEFDGSTLASGIYFYRITARSLDGAGGTFEGVKKMVLVK